MNRKTLFLTVSIITIFSLASPSFLHAASAVLTEGSKIKYKKKNIVLLGGINTSWAEDLPDTVHDYNTQLQYLKVLLESFKRENSLVLWLKAKDEELSEHQVLTPVQHIDKQGMGFSLPQQNMPAYDHVSLVQAPQLVPLSQDMNSGTLARSAGYELVPVAKVTSPYDYLESPLAMSAEQPSQSQLSQNSGRAHAADHDNDLSKRQRRKSRKSAHYNSVELQGFASDTNNAHKEPLNPRDNGAQGSVQPQQNVSQYDRVQPLIQTPNNGSLRNPIFENDANSRRLSETSPVVLPGNYVQLSLLRPVPSQYFPPLHRSNEASSNFNVIDNQNDMDHAKRDRKDYESKLGIIELFVQDNAQNLNFTTYNQFLNQAKSLYEEYYRRTGASIDESNIPIIKALNAVEVLYTFQRIYSNEKKNIVVIAPPELDIKAIETIFEEQGAQVLHYFRTMGKGLTKPQLQALLKMNSTSLRTKRICQFTTIGVVSVAILAIIIWLATREWSTPSVELEPLPNPVGPIPFPQASSTLKPTAIPTTLPTSAPTAFPTIAPTPVPTAIPTPAIPSCPGTCNQDNSCNPLYNSYNGGSCRAYCGGLCASTCSTCTCPSNTSCMPWW